jgi:hypothetical protein
VQHVKEAALVLSGVAGESGTVLSAVLGDEDGCALFADEGELVVVVVDIELLVGSAAVGVDDQRAGLVDGEALAAVQCGADLVESVLGGFEGNVGLHAIFLDIISVIKEVTSAGLLAVTYSPRLIIIIFMSKREDLLGLFTAMMPDAIKKYPPAHVGSLPPTRTTSSPSSTLTSTTPNPASTNASISTMAPHPTAPSSADACPASSGGPLPVSVVTPLKAVTGLNAVRRRSSGRREVRQSIYRIVRPPGAAGF